MSLGGAFAVASGLVALVIVPWYLWTGHRQRKAAFELMDRLNRTGRIYLARWRGIAIEEGATSEQAVTIAAQVMRK